MAFILLARSLAAEWGRYGMRFNAIAPGPIETKVMQINVTILASFTYRHAMRGDNKALCFTYIACLTCITGL